MHNRAFIHPVHKPWIIDPKLILTGEQIIVVVKMMDIVPDFYKTFIKTGLTFCWCVFKLTVTVVEIVMTQTIFAQ